MHIYGAGPTGWKHWADTLGLGRYLLPVVSNPAAVISPDSRMVGLGKTPSLYNFRRQVAGIKGWAAEEYRARPGDLDRWAAEDDYGICLRTGTIASGLYAIDIDIKDAATARAVIDCVAETLPYITMPVRLRSDSSKCLLVFASSVPLTKRVIPVGEGMIEWLGNGQQFIAMGTHTDGQPYQWLGGLPKGFDPLDQDEIDLLWLTLCERFSTGEPTIARERKRLTDMTMPDGTDERAEWLLANWECFDVDPDRIYIRCPFEDQHTTDTGITSTAYFLAGTGGFEQGHFRCLHAHCEGRTNKDYLDAMGWSVAQFPVLPDPEAPRGEDDDADDTALDDKPWPTFKRQKGEILATADNMVMAMEREDVIERWLCYDRFRDEIVHAPADQQPEVAKWKPFGDPDYVDVQRRMERMGFKDLGWQRLRNCLHAVARGRQIDIASHWLARRQWDGVPRVERFFADYLKTEDTEYAKALGRYVWSAHAGRVLDPGCQADMSPVLIGPQGGRKTSAIKAIAPGAAMFTEIDLSTRDENLSRQMRGKLVGELGELRGLASRDAEAIKAWLTRRDEEWVPKYMEFATTYPRRLLLWGSGNVPAFLADKSGNRRWLPIHVTVTHRHCDVEAVARDRDQLWAEGAHLFLNGGVRFEDAERLAEAEHFKFEIDDEWAPLIQHWLHKPDVDGVAPIDWERGVIVADIALGALGIPIARLDPRTSGRILGVLRALGFARSYKRDVSRNRYVAKVDPLLS